MKYVDEFLHEFNVTMGEIQKNNEAIGDIIEDVTISPARPISLHSTQQSSQQGLGPPVKGLPLSPVK